MNLIHAILGQIIINSKNFDFFRFIPGLCKKVNIKYFFDYPL